MRPVRSVLIDWSRIVTTGVATIGVIAGENCTDDNDNCNDRADEPPRPSVGSVAYQTVIRVIHLAQLWLGGSSRLGHRTLRVTADQDLGIFQSERRRVCSILTTPFV